MITFFKPARWSSVPTIAELMSTRVVCWKEAAERKLRRVNEISDTHDNHLALASSPAASREILSAKCA